MTKLMTGDAKVISWFSCGVSSAIATKLAVDQLGCKNVLYIDIDDAHPDNERFIAECEDWYGLKIQRLRSARYRSVDSVITSQQAINFNGGAPCTQFLKQRVRQLWESGQTGLSYVWGFDINEKERADKRIDALPDYHHLFPLVERSITKEMAHGMLMASGIKRPVMYDLGFPNNNCIGCVRGGMGYWNLIRIHFPRVFALMAKRERELGSSCITEKINGVKVKVFLDALDPNRGRGKIIVPDCGLFCEIQ